MKRCLITLALTVSTWSAAAAGDSPWTIRFHAAIIRSPEQQTVIGAPGGGSRTEVGAGGGVGLAAEYRFSQRIGLEMSTLLGGVDIDTSFLAGSSSAVQTLELTTIPLSLAVPFHFAVGRQVDLYLGPALSYLLYEDIRNSAIGGSASSTVEVGSDTGFGIFAGLEAGFGRGGWAFNGGLRYVRSDFEGRDFDPLIVTLGFAYRF